MPELKTIEELLKSGIIKKGNDPELIVQRLPLGIPSLDNMLGGGLPIGRCIHCYGPESTGKTLVAQYAVAAVQKSKYPLCLYMDMERSYDEDWWKLSGVDTTQLLVSDPPTAEQAIDIMRGVLNSSEQLGMIIVDSVAAMIPQPLMDPEKSSEDNRQPGQQAKVVTLMYHQIIPLLKNRVILLTTNQMRDTIGGHDEFAALPGGRANRHYNHIILRTRRDSWITEKEDRIGFWLEVVNRKNKLATTADGDSIMLPFMFTSQIDWTTSYIDDAIKAKIITRKGPYYYWNNENYMGMAKLREFFTEHPDELEVLRNNLAVS